jgi:hypothetical protein
MHNHYTQNDLLPCDRRAMNGAKLLPLPIHELVTMYLYANISI